MSLTGENISSVIVVPFVLTVYLNLYENNTNMYNSNKFVQENSKIYNDQSKNDDKISDDRDCFDIPDLAGDRPLRTGEIVHHERPIYIIDNYESILLFIDLPPPLIII